jgi:hypothetical protein
LPSLSPMSADSSFEAWPCPGCHLSLAR